MKLVVFGASGGTGQEIVKQALEQGHEVTGFVRDSKKLAIKITCTFLKAMRCLIIRPSLRPSLGGTQSSLGETEVTSQRKIKPLLGQI